MRIGEIVKERREKKGLNQTELADLAGIKQATISRLESGKNENVTIENLRAIAIALNCSLVSLLTDEDKKVTRKLDSAL